ncbi:MAG: hypothetical protein KBD01_12710 [Acidobacteria bacterium]|nr:hypothetical protein [Acidobacteriota bacterium]
MLPEVPVRQWVLALPFPLRVGLAYDPRLAATVLREFVRAAFGSLRRRAARQLGLRHPLRRGHLRPALRRPLNLNLHFHTLALDGVYEIRAGSAPRFHPLPPPTDDDVARVVARVARRLARLFTRDPELLAHFPERQPALAALAAAAARGRCAAGPRAG